MDTLTADLLQSCKILIASAKTDEAINTLMNSFAKSQHDILILSGQWAELKNQKITNTISLDDFKRESSRINKSILEVLDKLEKGTDFSSVKNKLGGIEISSTNSDKKIKISNSLFFIITVLIIVSISGIGVYRLSQLDKNTSTNNEKNIEINLFESAHENLDKGDEKSLQVAVKQFREFIGQYDEVTEADKLPNAKYSLARIGLINSLYDYFRITKKDSDVVIAECDKYAKEFKGDDFPFKIKGHVYKELGEKDKSKTNYDTAKNLRQLH